MKIIKISSRKDWQKYIEEFKQELKEKDIDKKEKITRNKLFNYIKTKNIKTTFFHGTSESLYEKMKEKGFMIPPSYMKTNNYEIRNEGLDKIFFTTDMKKTKLYEMRAEEQTNSEGITILLEIPIYRIAEVQAAIFDSYTYNEGMAMDDLKNIVNKYMPLLINNFDQYKDELVDEILKIINNSKYLEFTVYGIIPVNDTQKKGFNYVEKIDEISLNKIIELIENKKALPNNFSEKKQNDIPKKKWIQWIENGIVLPKFVLEEIKNSIPVNQWIEWVDDKNIYISIIDLTEKIKNDIPKEKWFEWMAKKDIKFFYVPDEIKKEFDVNQWTQLVEIKKNPPSFIPDPIKIKVHKKYWIKWIDEGRIYPFELPNEILKQSMNWYKSIKRNIK